MDKPTRGGSRKNAGRKPKHPKEKRTRISLSLSPDNAEFLTAMGRQKNSFVDGLLDREREETDSKAD